MESLIKLTVKTPNQHIEDIQIDCDLQWTVRKLKEYLQDVYPSNPVSLRFSLVGFFYRQKLPMEVFLKIAVLIFQRTNKTLKCKNI